jgi:hypothetical protein
LAVPLNLYVDTPAWHEHLRAEIARDPGLVPVAKGNGYGFSVPLLARTAADLGVDAIAVGTAENADVALGLFGGEVIVLETSMLLLPRDTDPPEPGEELGADLRYTATRFDRITLCGPSGQVPAATATGPRHHYLVPGASAQPVMEATRENHLDRVIAAHPARSQATMNTFLLQAADDLKASGNPEYQSAIDELTYLARLPATNDTATQRAKAKTDAQALDTFFGTPGLLS